MGAQHKSGAVPYELIDHTADFGLRISAADSGGLFTTAALALFEQIADTAGLPGNETRALTVEGDDWADLMVNWLRELLYLWSGEGLLVSRVTINEICENRLRAALRADHYQPECHSIRNEIKAVTYHQIEVKADETGWTAQVIFDV